MFGKSAAVLALAAACVVAGAQSSHAGSENSPWYETDSNASLSRANLSETVLSRTAVTKIKYLRSVVAPPVSPKNQCPQESAVAPVLVGGDLYAITAGKISKYDAATGSLIWRSTPNQQFVYESLTVSDNLVIAGGVYCWLCQPDVAPPSYFDLAPPGTVGAGAVAL